MVRTVVTYAVTIVTWIRYVTGSLDIVKEAVKLDGQEPYAIKVR